jgi:hypothetical protein
LDAEEDIVALDNATLVGVSKVTPTTPSNVGGTIPYAATDASTNVNGILQHVPTAMNRDSQDTPEVRV